MLAKNHSKASQKLHKAPSKKSLNKKQTPSSHSLSKTPKNQIVPSNSSHLKTLKSTKITQEMLIQLKQEVKIYLFQIKQMRQEVSKIKNHCSVCSETTVGTDANEVTALGESNRGNTSELIVNTKKHWGG